MVFRDDDNETKVAQNENCGSLIVKILNDKQTRQGTKYQVQKSFVVEGQCNNLLIINSFIKTDVSSIVIVKSNKTFLLKTFKANVHDLSVHSKMVTLVRLIFNGIGTNVRNFTRCCGLMGVSAGYKVTTFQPKSRSI